MRSYIQTKVNRVLNRVATSVAQQVISSQRFAASVAQQVISSQEFAASVAQRVISSQGSSAMRKIAPLCISNDTTHFYVHTSDGHRFFLDAKDLHISLHVLEHGCWEDHIRSALMQILKPGSTFIDVGGNVGLHTLFASSIVGTGGQVHTFEPLPHLFKTLELNVDVNGAGRTITTYQQAVSDSVGTASFSNFRTHSAMSGFTIPDERLECFREDREQSIELLTVNTTTLDAMFPGKVVDGLKVDVEGYEALVIRGARDLIKANSEVKIILEWDPDLVGKTVGEAKSEEMIYFLRSENFIPYLALWQKPLRRIEWDDAAAVRGDLILSRTPLRT